MKKTIYKALIYVSHLFGYTLELRRTHDPVLGKGYEVLRPKATYAPWGNNQEFSDIYNLVRSHTLVDKYRLYELWDLVSQTKNIEGSILEVGVWRGGSGVLIARRSNIDNPASDIFLCDTFQGVVLAGSDDSTYKGGEHADTSFEVVSGLIRDTHVKNTHLLQGIFPHDTGAKIQNEIFRFAHIDVDVYQSAKEVLEWVWPRLAVGGIVVFDDYGFFRCDGVTKIVNEKKGTQGMVVLYNLNGHAILIKTA